MNPFSTSIPATEAIPAELTDPRPVSQTERIQTIDTLRGVALLGILLMNIPGFGLGDNYDDTFRSDPTNINFWVYSFIGIVFEGKMRALFSMIFGVGNGLNQYAEWQFYQLYFLVAAIWILQLIVSPIWLRHYQFGPLEWVWRSLTYWQRQPMRRAISTP